MLKRNVIGVFIFLFAAVATGCAFNGSPVGVDGRVTNIVDLAKRISNRYNHGLTKVTNSKSAPIHHGYYGSFAMTLFNVGASTGDIPNMIDSFRDYCWYLGGNLKEVTRGQKNPKNFAVACEPTESGYTVDPAYFLFFVNVLVTPNELAKANYLTKAHTYDTTDPKAHTHAHSHASSDTHKHAQKKRETKAHTHAHSHKHTDTHKHADTAAQTHYHSDTQSHKHKHAHANGYSGDFKIANHAGYAGGYHEGAVSGHPGGQSSGHPKSYTRRFSSGYTNSYEEAFRDAYIGAYRGVRSGTNSDAYRDAYRGAHSHWSNYAYAHNGAGAYARDGYNDPYRAAARLPDSYTYKGADNKAYRHSQIGAQNYNYRETYKSAHPKAYQDPYGGVKNHVYGNTRYGGPSTGADSKSEAYCVNFLVSENLTYHTAFSDIPKFAELRKRFEAILKTTKSYC